MGKPWALGETRSIEGYDVLAHALNEDGWELRVLNNNSTHFLVVIMQDDGTDLNGRLLQTVGYGEDDGHAAYKTALNFMIGCV